MTTEIPIPRHLGPYRLEALLGKGGMGEVYRAYDTRLHRRVAIKILRPGEAAPTSSRERFLREARSAAALSHPNLVQIHDIVEDDSGDWIVMELVQGPTVAELLAEGEPLEPQRALSIARQVAEGLTAAHDQGILHRDLKTENIMLAPGDRVKVLDFGLAKRLWTDRPEASLSVEGRVLGTCRTMSPEQARGQTLDGRSDLFSLGVLLYEMLTGTSPFQQDTPLDTLTRVCHHEPPPVHQIRPRVPATVSALVARLMAKDPRERPADVHQVARSLRTLEGVSSQERGVVSGTAGPAPPVSAAAAPASSIPSTADSAHRQTLLDLPTRATSGTPRGSDGPVSLASGARWTLGSLGLGSDYHPQRRWLIAMGLLLILLLTGSGVAWMVTRSSQASPMPLREPRSSVAFLGFSNLSRQPAVDWMSTGLSEMLGAEVAASSGLRNVPGETVARGKRELDLRDGETLSAESLARVRSVLGADLVVMGSYVVLPDEPRSLRVDLNVQDTRQGETVLSLNRTGSQGELLLLVSELGEELRSRLVAGAPTQRADAGTATAQTVMPRDREAMRLYAEGLGALRGGRFPEARRLLEEAVTVEPGFPLAHAGLADAWSALGYDLQAQEAAARAARLAEGLPEEERLFVQARHHEMSWQWPQAIERYRRLWSTYPDNVDYGLRLAGALTRASRADEALELLGDLRAMPPPASEDVRIPLARAAAAEALSRYDASLAAAQEAAERGERQGAKLLVAEARLREAVAHLHLASPQRARRAVERARDLYQATGDLRGEALALGRLGDLSTHSGSYRQAVEIRRQALARLQQVGDRDGIAKAHNNLGSDLLFLGDVKAAEPHIRQAIIEAREVGDRRLEGAFHVTLSLLLQRRGDLTSAHQEASSALEISQELGFAYAEDAARWSLARILIARGELTQARAALEAGLERCLQAGDLQVAALFLTDLGRLAMELGETGAARDHHEEALRIRQQLWKAPIIAAENRLALGRLALEATPRRALTIARQALTDVGQDSADLRAAAAALQASAHLQLGDLQALQRELPMALDLAAGSQDLPTRLALQIQLAPCQAALGHRETARESLEDIRDQAGRKGLVLLERQAERALARMASQPESVAATN